MKWTFHELGLMQVLTWYEWTLMACVFFLLIVAVIQFINVMRGE